MLAIKTKSITYNVCAKCEMSFKVWSEYYHHINTMKCVKIIKPINTTGRKKEEIVMNAERTWLKPFLLIVILSLSVFAYADGGDDDGGSQGPQGPQGVQGPAGPQGIQGAKGNSGTNGSNGTNGVNGSNGTNGLNADSPGSRFLGELDVRLWDTKYTSLYAFDSYNFNDGHDQDFIMDGRNAFYGFKFVVKFGKSYEEQRIEELEKKIEALRAR